MPKYVKNLEHLFEKFDQKFTQKTILLLGISILEIFEKVHASGYTYNDLKLDNILIGDENFSDKSLHQIRLIDFGFAEKFMNPNGTHIMQEDADFFRGNMIFASMN